MFAIVFIVLLAWASYDIATRTTFPGSKPQLKERLKGNDLESPVNVSDTLSNRSDSTAQGLKK